jgi:acetylserotonin N-methyltransferase
VLTGKIAEVASAETTRLPLEPPTADHRIVWDIWLSSHILPIAAVSDEMGIFTLLEHGPLTTAEAARELDLSTEWAEVLLGVLATIELVRVQDRRFHLTDAARCFFLPESPYYSGFTLRRFAERGGMTERLKRALSSSQSASERYAPRVWKPGDISQRDLETSMRTMHGLSFPAAVGAARNGNFTGVRRLLDVAGGSGGFSIALALRYPHMRCTVAELDAVRQLTLRYIEEYGVQDQVDTIALNMFYEPWPTGYDAAFFSCVLHDWDLEHRTELVRRAFEMLPADGRIYIHEMLMGDAADGPSGPALFNAEMRIGTLGKQFTAPELRQALETAGFTDVVFQNTHGYFSLTWARKPHAH